MYSHGVCVYVFLVYASGVQSLVSAKTIEYGSKATIHSMHQTVKEVLS